MIESSGQGGHSAQVKMQLLFNGSSIPVVEMGPDFLVLESTTEHPPVDATIQLRIDSSERKWNVRLPEGISKSSPTVTISKII
jgi:hypothetical protein